MKKCNKCSEWRDLTAYKRDPRNKDGLQGICKECNKGWQRKRREEISAGINVKIITEKTCNTCRVSKSVDLFYRDMGSTDGYHSLCKSCRNKTMSKWRGENRERYNYNMRHLRANNKEWAKNNDLKRTHNITLQEYNKKLIDQNNVCAMCKQPPKGKRPLVVDHDHSTGAIRDLLCYGCNRALHVLEAKELLKTSLDYLEKHKKETK